MGGGRSFGRVPPPGFPAFRLREGVDRARFVAPPLTISVRVTRFRQVWVGRSVQRPGAGGASAPPAPSARLGSRGPPGSRSASLPGYWNPSCYFSPDTPPDAPGSPEAACRFVHDPRGQESMLLGGGEWRGAAPCGEWPSVGGVGEWRRPGGGATPSGPAALDRAPGARVRRGWGTRAASGGPDGVRQGLGTDAGRCGRARWPRAARVPRVPRTPVHLSNPQGTSAAVIREGVRNGRRGHHRVPQGDRGGGPGAGMRCHCEGGSFRPRRVPLSVAGWVSEGLGAAQRGPVLLAGRGRGRFRVVLRRVGACVERIGSYRRKNVCLHRMRGASSRVRTPRGRESGPGGDF